MTKTSGLLIFVLCFSNEIIFITSMLIPQDIEILDGYKIDESSSSSSSEYYPPDTFLEAESLRNYALTKAIRNRRSPFYHILESPGLFSHFHHFENFIEPSKYNKPLSQIKQRQKRSEKSDVKNEEKTPSDKIEKDSKTESPQQLPVAEKQIMEPANEYYRKGWNIHSFHTDYSRGHPIDDDDPLPEASTNEGIKGRTPRVNFITHPKKSYDEIKERTIAPKYTASIIPLSGASRYERLQAPYQSYPDMYPSRSYDPYLRRYDRFDDQFTRYDPYYEDFYLYRKRFDPYDSYSPRMPTHPEPYYDYPDRRFDVPEPRDYRPLYSNDLYYDRPPSHDRSSRRIIYYAHLPEIVRSPPSIDLSYGNYGRDHRYDSYSYGSSSSSGGSLGSGGAGAGGGGGGGGSGGVSGTYHGPDKNTASNIKDDYGFIKREKKDHRNYPQYQKSSSTSNLKQDP